MRRNVEALHEIHLRQRIVGARYRDTRNGVVGEPFAYTAQSFGVMTRSTFRAFA